LLKLFNGWSRFLQGESLRVTGRRARPSSAIENQSPGEKTVGWVERSEPHQEQVKLSLVGLATTLRVVPLDPPYNLRTSPPAIAMQVYEFGTWDELAPYAQQWDRLAASVPFRSWTWLSHWWRHYGRQGARSGLRLMVLGVFDQADLLVGAAPWCLESSGPRGEVIRWLGSGEVCSDYVSILCQPAVRCGVVEAIADYLAAAEPSGAGPVWDLLELGNVDVEDPAADALIRLLAEHGHPVHRRPAPNCWRLPLPATWEEYLERLSKSHRKQLRRCQRDWFNTGRAVLHTVQRLDELPAATALLIDLHRRRWRSLGQAGCFSSPRFTAFHREVMPALLREGHLQLHWLELDGRPVAAEYHLTGSGVIYAYKAGIAPEALADQPGRLITMAILQRAIRQGYRAVDFLRGDEPYKAHFRAVPRPMCTLRAVANRRYARLRHNLWLAGANATRWLRSRL
jgi:CelD/BcsL family acetyltransferase involved in cellulose biosynthesis